MLGLLLTLLIVVVALIVVLWVGTTFAQGFFYDSPVDGLAWRAPAAAGLVSLFLIFWTFLEYKYPGGTDTIFNYSDIVETDVPRFWSLRKTDRDEKEILFERHMTSGSRPEYRDADQKTWSRSSSGMMVAIIVEEKKGTETVRKRFNAEMKDGKFAPQTHGRAEQSLRYIEEGGSRYISEDLMGKIIGHRRGRLVWVILLNIVHLVVWFAVLWPILRFQWPHALGFAFVLWLVMTLAVVPILFDQAHKAAKKTAPPPAAALQFRNPPALFSIGAP